jgi:hypothetical protein
MPPKLSGSRARQGDGMKKPPKARLEAAMRETHTNVPSTVTRANVSAERKEKMKRAIAFKKARGG